MGRPPKYDWEDKRDICYQLHVEQKLSGSQIVKHFADHFGVPANQLPGVNQFYARFRLWGFPSRKNWFTAEDKEQIVARTRELFNQNRSAQDTLNTLQEEGWDIDRYQFRVLRKKHGMILRSAPGYRKLEEGAKKSKRSDDEEDVEDGAHEADEEVKDNTPNSAEKRTLPPAEAARRAQRMVDLQAESDELLRSRKRRRRIRGYGHLPPDGPGMQPRYNSETSLDECKAYLELSNEAYVTIREQFSQICREMGIVKMTLCREGQWQTSKDRLVSGNMHLSSTLHPLEDNLDKKWNALSCICTDVTKRMRNQSRFMSIADANNVLQLNPAESKEVRRVLYEILAADQFTSIVTCGKERMDELRQQWYARVPTLQQAISESDSQKQKALDVLCKDVRKRFCDDQTRQDPSKKQAPKQNHYGPGPGPALPSLSAKGATKKSRVSPGDVPLTNHGAIALAGLAAYNPSWENNETSEFRYSNLEDSNSNFDLDPLLNTAIRGAP